MKKLIFLSLIIVSSNLLSQKQVQVKDTLDSKIDYTNYCLYKFQKSQKIGMTTTFIGASLIAIGNFSSLNGLDKTTQDYNFNMAVTSDEVAKIILTEQYGNKLQEIEKRRKTLTTTGGVFVVGGCLLSYISYRWLKNAYVVPIENGVAVGVRYNF